MLSSLIIICVMVSNNGLDLELASQAEWQLNLRVPPLHPTCHVVLTIDLLCLAISIHPRLMAYKVLPVSILQ